MPESGAGIPGLRCGDEFRIARLQLLEIARGVEQPIRVVDAQAADRAVPGEIEHVSVRCLEDLRILHAQRRQIVDIKKAPIVDFVRCDPPVREPVGLRIEQHMQRVEARTVARDAVQALQLVLDRVT